MLQRIVILKGASSSFLHGDPDVSNLEYMGTGQDGVQYPAAIPKLLEQGWSVKSVFPFGNSEDSAIVLLEKE